MEGKIYTLYVWFEGTATEDVYTNVNGGSISVEEGFLFFENGEDCHGVNMNKIYGYKLQENK